MFLFVLAKLLPKRHNLYGNSLDFKLKIYERKKSIKSNFNIYISASNASGEDTFYTAVSVLGAYPLSAKAAHTS